MPACTVVSAALTSFTINIGANAVAGNPSGNAFLPYNFTVNTTGMSTASYNGVTNTVTITASGYTAGHQVYVKFSNNQLAGGTYDGVYTIASATSTTFTITLSGSPPATSSGTAYIPRFTGGYNIVNVSNVSTIYLNTAGNHNLKVGDSIEVVNNDSVIHTYTELISSSSLCSYSQRSSGSTERSISSSV